MSTSTSALIDLSSLKVGDKVFHIIHGECEVSNLDIRDKYPISIEYLTGAHHEDGIAEIGEESFCKDGREYDYHKYPSLYACNPFQFALDQVKKGKAEIKQMKLDYSELVQKANNYSSGYLFGDPYEHERELEEAEVMPKLEIMKVKEEILAKSRSIKDYSASIFEHKTFSMPPLKESTWYKRKNDVSSVGYDYYFISGPITATSIPACGFFTDIYTQRVGLYPDDVELLPVAEIDVVEYLETRLKFFGIRTGKTVIKHAGRFSFNNPKGSIIGYGGEVQYYNGDFEYWKGSVMVFSAKEGFCTVSPEIIEE